MRTLWGVAVLLIAGWVLLVPQPAGAAGDPEAHLRAAARRWERVFLTGSPQQIMAMEGPECRGATSTTIPRQMLERYLAAERSVMRKHLGVPLDRVPVLGVEVRNVMPTSGEARVVYGLPESKVGNDNWVEFRHDGSAWKVADCNAPIGGWSSSSSSS